MYRVSASARSVTLIARARAHARQPDRELQSFERLSTLGTGSFGRVILARDKIDGTYCAVKVLCKAKVVRLKQVEHSLNEKRILHAINFPFIVNLLHAFQDPVNLYMVMEFVAGGEVGLRQWR